MKRVFITILSALFLETFTKADSPSLSSNSSATVQSAATQLQYYAATHHNATVARTTNGHVFVSITETETVGLRGPVLLQDRYAIERIQMFTRERIAPRVVHAKGTGALGYFEVTNDIRNYTKADFLQPGRRTKVAVRFSQGLGDQGSPDNNFDTKGFAVKFYTNDGIHDLTSLQVPVLFSSDASSFQDIIHAFKKNPKTNLPDSTAAIDILSKSPEATMFLLTILSGPGNPRTYRCTRGFAINTFKMVNAAGGAVYVKFRWVPHEPEEYLTLAENVAIWPTSLDYQTQDLYDSIAKGDYPQWTLNIQVMTFKQAEEHYENPFDTTKVWKTDEFPLIPVGVLTLNDNTQNHFAQVEQIAFKPANMVPGIEPSPDRLLHSRMFAYTDAQLHRLGVNHYQIPINSCPFTINSYQRDGLMNVGTNGGDAPNYYPNSFNGPQENTDPFYKETVFHVSGDVNRVYAGGNPFSQPQWYWNTQVNATEQQIIIQNLLALTVPANKDVQRRFVNNIIYNVNSTFGDAMKTGLNL